MFYPATENDFDEILKLNKEFEQYLSPLDKDALHLLHEKSEYHKTLKHEGNTAGFLLAFREGSDYQSVNYKWFNERYPSFLYVDRVVVSGAMRGQNIGMKFYQDLIEHAKSLSLPLIACEYNIIPLNEGSARFHEKMGFSEVGRQAVQYGDDQPRKEVSMQVLEIAA